MYKIGDKIKYKPAFLRRLKFPAEYSKYRGKIIFVDPAPVGRYQYLKIAWNDGPEMGALSKNITITK